MKKKKNQKKKSCVSTCINKIDSVMPFIMSLLFTIFVLLTLYNLKKENDILKAEVISQQNQILNLQEHSNYQNEYIDYVDNVLENEGVNIYE